MIPKRTPARIFALVALGLLIVPPTLGACLAAPGYQGEPIEPGAPGETRFDGEIFENMLPFPQKGFGRVIKWQLFGETPKYDWDDTDWKERSSRTYPPPPKKNEPGSIGITWINHATVLIQIGGINIITDPIFSNTAGPVIGPDRFRPPGVSLENLPRIHMALVSHNHYDHMDIDSLEQLHERFETTLVGGLGTKALLSEENLPAVDLRWWQTIEREGVTVHMVPAQHWSRRGFGDTRNTLWGGYVITQGEQAVYYAGDTGWGPHFELIGERFENIRIALLPVGAYLPRWFMKNAHISPEEAVDAATVLGAEVSIPVHYGTFNLGDDGPDEPVADLQKYLNVASPAPKFEILDNGMSYLWKQAASAEAASSP